PAIRAKAMACMPVEERLAFGERRQMVGLDQATHRDRAQIGDDELVPCFEHLRGRRLECDRESRRVLAEAEKNDLRRAARCARLCSNVNSGSARAVALLRTTNSPATT